MTIRYGTAPGVEGGEGLAGAVEERALQDDHAVEIEEQRADAGEGGPQVGRRARGGHRHSVPVCYPRPMGLLDGKQALIFGVANDHSIAWGIAKALHEQGATVGFSSVESLIEKRVRPLATSIGSTFVEPCDVQSDDADPGASSRSGARPTAGSTSSSTPWPSPGARTSRVASSTRRATGFALALDVSAYSLVALVREARPFMDPGRA